MSSNKKNLAMVAGGLALYFALQLIVLPRLGIQT
jgi:hypothetical protein